jgi:hypothetical protein
MKSKGHEHASTLRRGHQTGPPGAAVDVAPSADHVMKEDALPISPQDLDADLSGLGGRSDPPAHRLGGPEGVPEHWQLELGERRQGGFKRGEGG